MTFFELHSEPTLKQLKWFAALWLPAFGAFLGSVFYFKVQRPDLAVTMWLLTLALGILSYKFLYIARIIYVGLSALTYPIGWVMSHVLMAAVFLGVLLPVGLALRLSGRDVLGKTFNRKAESYWQICLNPKRLAEYFRQY